MIANVKGGVGKTTAAVNLAAIAGSHGPVILVDADPQASAAEWLEASQIPGVRILEAPSERLIHRASELGEGSTVIIDTPPGSERLVRAAIGIADIVVTPTKVGGVEISRVQATVSMLGNDTVYGLVVTSARTGTKDFQEAIKAYHEVGIPMWGIIPERVGIASGPDNPLHRDGLEAYGDVWLEIGKPKRRV